MLLCISDIYHAVQVSATSEAAAQGDASTPQQVDTAAPATPAQGKSFAAVAAGKPASDSAAAQGAEQQSSEVRKIDFILSVLLLTVGYASSA